jgi:hypothetical protein
MAQFEISEAANTEPSAAAPDPKSNSAINSVVGLQLSVK